MRYRFILWLERLCERVDTWCKRERFRLDRRAA